ncbi:hypothetical protein HK101_003825 [Irineochytrium annulatum]|nr:hypothetical protein HK101_003825 [Irineochytrium annulatum]
MLARRFSTAAANWSRTALHDFHVANGGKMVEFAGWSMPLQYQKLGVLASHHWTRENASLFDVGHMMQTRWSGKDAARFLETLVVADTSALPAGQSTLSVFTNEEGGIVDDTVITRIDDTTFGVVNNAGSAEKIRQHVEKHRKAFKGDVKVEVVDHALLALQGPKAAEALSALNPSFSLPDLKFMSSTTTKLTLPKATSTIPLTISRCGYTGEDGFELSLPHSQAVSLATALLAQLSVELAGLGARDSLRLEAGLCLYGHDIDDTTSPVEAGLTWTIGKGRREKGGFLGEKRVLGQVRKEVKVERRRVGLIVEGSPARENAPISTTSGTIIGKVTSGCPSPVLKQNIAMGYVADGHHKIGTELMVTVRNRVQKAKVVKMPFVPSRYYK